LQYSTPQYKLGVKDANELLESFLLSGKILELDNEGLDAMTNSLLPVETLALQIDNTDSTRKEQDTENLKKGDQDKGCCKAIKNNCVIFSVKDMIYDNQLLNHPDILRSSVQEFGISRVLDMSSNLSSELISEAIEQNDAELLLVGCISLNYSDAI